MHTNPTRREWLCHTAAAVSGAYLAGSSLARAATAPTAPVAVARCTTYDPNQLLAAMEKMFDQLGGLGGLVKGKTVAIKINLTGAPTYRLANLLPEDTHFTHPRVIAAAVHLMGKAGARRIRVLESPWSTAGPVEQYLRVAKSEPRDILSAAPNVEFENTNYLGQGKKYSRLVVPYGGYIFPAFDLNHSYEDCDVFVSIAKMKEHATAGVTLSMKNCFGMTPATIYGTGAGRDEPSVVPNGGRTLVHKRPHNAASGYLPGAADGGRSDFRSSDSPGDCRRHQDYGRWRRSVGPRGFKARGPGRDGCGHEPRYDRRGLHGVDGFRSHGGSRHSSIREV
jgi:hypothetical protein